MSNATAPLLIAKNDSTELSMLPALANRHGLITGATGTGKTVTLQALAQRFSDIGVPVFMADIKGDLTGITQSGGGNPKVNERLKLLKLDAPEWKGCPATLWDVYGEQGHPVRATISDMGPLLLARMLDLNEVQAGVLNIVFRVADDNGLLLLDLKDLRAMCQHVGDNASQYTTKYGNVSTASVGAIQRSLLGIEDQGGNKFFGEPMLNIDDFMQTVNVAPKTSSTSAPQGGAHMTWGGPTSSGKGIVNVLAADKLLTHPRLYSTFLLWLLSELFEKLPEVGDLDKPKLVFFFDEAHLLFADAPKVLMERIELLVRLVRSKGVGVYFCTQNPLDVPDSILGQLGNRFQHALRAFTPRDQKAVQTAAETMRPNPKLDIVQAITELAVGEALVSLLDEKGRPTITERAFIVPPASQIGPITPEQRKALLSQSIVAGAYEKAVDRESAYEKLTSRTGSRMGDQSDAEAKAEQAKDASKDNDDKGGILDTIGDIFSSAGNNPRSKGSTRQSVGEAMVKSTVRAIGSEVGRQIIRGVLGGILGKRR